MKKSDLKTGMTVRSRGSVFYRVLRNVETRYYGFQEILFVGLTSGFQTGDSFTKNLKYKDDYDGSICDIVKVYEKQDDGAILNTSIPLESDLIWERKDDDFVTLTTEDGRKIKISKKSLEELKKL